jgi:hypothetical protein
LRRYRYACARCVVRLHVVRRARFVRFVRSVRSVYGGANELDMRRGATERGGFLGQRGADYVDASRENGHCLLICDCRHEG